MAEDSGHVADDPGDKAAMARMLWRSYLTGDQSRLSAKVKLMRRALRYLPSDPRCKVCNAPFHGIGHVIVGPFGYGASASILNPTLCNQCDKLVKKYEVGVEVELTLLFADVRGSTALAQETSPSEFHRLIDRFYTASTDVLVESGALIEKLIGDEVAGLYVPGIAGPDHARRAVAAAQALLDATGHGDVDGPWISVGAGVHSGTAYVGNVGSRHGMNVITVLGDAANTTARLASAAGAGEILVSEDSCQLGGLALEDCEQRALDLKGRSDPIRVRVLGPTVTNQLSHTDQ